MKRIKNGTTVIVQVNIERIIKRNVPVIHKDAYEVDPPIWIAGVPFKFWNADCMVIKQQKSRDK